MSEGGTVEQLETDRRETTLLESVYSRIRPELVCYATRLVIRPEVAEEIVQEAAIRWIQASSTPGDGDGGRAWLFRVVTNLAIDHRRKHSTWRETILLEARMLADRDEAFQADTQRMAGSPETKAIAREHLALCFACTLRNFSDRQSAALLLVEVYDFTLHEVADIMELRPAQVKHALQSARAGLWRKYGSSCQLVAKEGACHQCVELDVVLNGQDRNPLAGSAGDIAARIDIVRDLRKAPLNPWHQRMMTLVDEALMG